MSTQAYQATLDFGIDLSIRFYWRPDPEGPRADLSTYTAQMQIREYADTSAPVVLSIDSDGSPGTSRIRLDQTDDDGDSYAEIIILASDHEPMLCRDSWCFDVVLTTGGISERALKGSTIYVCEGVTQSGDFS